MSEGKTIRISKVLKDVNISLSTAAEELKKHKNIEIDESPNTKISEEAYQFLLNKFSADKSKRAVSKEIVEAHHGRIWADSAEGAGSTFYISLPYEAISEEGENWDEV